MQITDGDIYLRLCRLPGEQAQALKVLYQTIQLLNAKNKGEKIRFEITNLADGMRTGTGVSVYIPCNYSYDL